MKLKGRAIARRAEAPLDAAKVYNPLRRNESRMKDFKTLKEKIQ
jgi:hypothetical protein